MVKEFLMKKLLISLGVFACVTVNAQTASDSVVMMVAGKQVPLSEFIFIAEKNGEVDLSNTKSVKNYVELFKNFKLKVAEAESLGIDQTSSFKSELDGYRAQLIDSYMSDKEGEKAAARAVYDRGDHSVELTHILFRLPEKTVSKDTVAVYQEAMRVYERLQSNLLIIWSSMKKEKIWKQSEKLWPRRTRSMSLANMYVACSRCNP